MDKVKDGVSDGASISVPAVLLLEVEESGVVLVDDCFGRWAVGGDCVCCPGKVRSVPGVREGSRNSSLRVAAKVLIASNAEDMVTTLSLPDSLS